MWGDRNAEFRHVSEGALKLNWLSAASWAWAWEGYRLMRSYLAGQLAGAQVVLHGQRLSHVSHRLVDLLQVTLVLHLHTVLADTLKVTKWTYCISKSVIFVVGTWFPLIINKVLWYICKRILAAWRRLGWFYSQRVYWTGPIKKYSIDKTN